MFKSTVPVGSLWKRLTNFLVNIPRDVSNLVFSSGDLEQETLEPNLLQRTNPTLVEQLNLLWSKVQNPVKPQTKKSISTYIVQCTYTVQCMRSVYSVDIPGLQICLRESICTNPTRPYFAILLGEGEEEMSIFLLRLEAGLMGVLNPSGATSVLLSRSSHRRAWGQGVIFNTIIGKFWKNNLTEETPKRGIKQG